MNRDRALLFINEDCRAFISKYGDKAHGYTPGGKASGMEQNFFVYIMSKPLDAGEKLVWKFGISSEKMSLVRKAILCINEERISLWDRYRLTQISSLERRDITEITATDQIIPRLPLFLKPVLMAVVWAAIPLIFVSVTGQNKFDLGPSLITFLVLAFLLSLVFVGTAKDEIPKEDARGILFKDSSGNMIDCGVEKSRVDEILNAAQKPA